MRLSALFLQFGSLLLFSVFLLSITLQYSIRRVRVSVYSVVSTVYTKRIEFSRERRDLKSLLLTKCTCIELKLNGIWNDRKNKENFVEEKQFSYTNTDSVGLHSFRWMKIYLFFLPITHSPHNFPFWIFPFFPIFFIAIIWNVEKHIACACSEFCMRSCRRRHSLLHLFSFVFPWFFHCRFKINDICMMMVLCCVCNRYDDIWTSERDVEKMRKVIKWVKRWIGVWGWMDLTWKIAIYAFICFTYLFYSIWTIFLSTDGARITIYKI